MLAYVARKVVFSVVVLFFASIVIFGLVSLSGDPLSDLRQNPRLQAEDVERMTAVYGLDRSYQVQYAIWLHGACSRGIWG